MKLVVGIGGASGSLYGVRLVEELHKAGVDIHLIFSSGGTRILEHETALSAEDLYKKATKWYRNDDLFAGPASGSFRVDGMIIAPCSMKTLSAVATGYGDTLMSRAASCCLKEHKKLVLVLRETPLDLPSLRNMVVAAESGAVILPAMPGFYHRPSTIDDMVDFVVGKILDQFSIDHSLFKRWKG